MKTLNFKQVAAIVTLIFSISNNLFGQNNELVQNGDVLNHSAFIHFCAGVQYDVDEDYENAISEFSKAIQFDPKFAEAYDRRAVVYTKMIKYRKAMNDLTKALELQPNNSDFLNHRGILYYCLQKYSNALEDYTKALENNPSYAKVYYNRGIVKLVLDDEIGAYADIKTASNLNFKEATDYLHNNELALQ